MSSNTSAETPEEGTSTWGGNSRKDGHYWVNRKGHWRIAEFYLDKEDGGKWFQSGSRLTLFGDYHWDEIDERRIERQASLERENAELKERIKTYLDAIESVTRKRLDLQVVIEAINNVSMQAETIKRYKDALEEIRYKSEELLGMTAMEIHELAKSALEGNNE